MRWLIELSVLTSTDANLLLLLHHFTGFICSALFSILAKGSSFSICICSITAAAQRTEHIPRHFWGVAFAFPCPVSVCVMRIIARYSISILNEFVPEVSGRSDPFQPGSLLCGLWWRQEQPSRNVQRFSAHQFRCPSAYCTCMYVAAVALPL